MLPSRALQGLFLFAPLASLAAGQDRLLEVVEPPSGAAFGRALSQVGDIDGDGLPELAIGDSASGNGRISVVSGASGALIRTYLPGSQGDSFGYSFAPIADLDGDGQEDLVVGDPRGSGTRGRVDVLSGASGSILWSFVGTTGSQRVGHSVAVIEDIDGDGFEDVLVGAPMDDVGFNDNRGKLRAFSGSSGALLWTLNGTTSIDGMGYAIDVLSDANGDGVEDVVVASSAAAGDNVNRYGEVHLVSGVDGSILHHIPAGVWFEWFGHDVAGLPDIDGDGAGDFAIGTARRRVGSATLGAVELISGATGAVIWETPGPGGGLFGYALDASEDVDGDGVPDLVVGAHEVSGFNLRGGSAYVLSGATGAVHFAIPGRAYGRRFGVGVCGMSDLNGDGFAEFAAAGDSFTAGVSSPGLAAIHRGGGSTTETIQSVCPNPPAASGIVPWLELMGSTSVDAGQVGAWIGDAPPFSTVLLFLSAGPASPMSRGRFELCIGAAASREVTFTDPWGGARQALGAQVPGLLAGTTWTIQAAIRDSAAADRLVVTEGVQFRLVR